MIYLEKENLNELVSSGIHLVVFYTDSCAGCSFMMPIVDSLSEDINIIKINIDKFKELSDSFDIKAYPSLFIYKDGVRVKDLPGYHSKEKIEIAINEIKNGN